MLGNVRQDSRGTAHHQRRLQLLEECRADALDGSAESAVSFIVLHVNLRSRDGRAVADIDLSPRRHHDN
jgi:hypothetical protein